MSMGTNTPKSIVRDAMPTDPRFQNLTARTFGRLHVVEFAGHRSEKNRQILWTCRCLCGRTVVVEGSRLRNGDTRSCGCLMRELRTTHGHSRGYRTTPTFRVWWSMIQRTTHPSQVGYPNYGGRGIRVCDRWRRFETFLADMGDRPSPRHTLDRIDNDGDYTPDNCRWATIDQQARNRRTNVWVTYRGETLCITDWAKRLGIEPSGLRSRLKRWPLERAMTEPPGVGVGGTHDAPRVTFRGETLRIAEWAKRLGMRRTTLRERIRRLGVTERAFTTPVQRYVRRS